MNIQGPLRKIISENPASYALVGDRVYPVVAPQNSAYPLVVITVIGNSPAPVKTHTSTVDNVLIECRVYAATFEACANADEAVRNAIDQYRGDVTHLGVTHSIDGIRYETTQQGIEGESYLFVSASNYTVRLKRDGVIGSEYVNLRYFDSDESAISAGLQVGDLYRLTTNNFYGMKGGTVVTVI